IKQYYKEGRGLRTETTINDPRDFEIHRGLRNLPALRQVGFHANRRLLAVQRLSHDCVMGEAAVQAVTRPVVVAGQRAAALRFADPRVLTLFHALVLFPLLPVGFSNADLRGRLAALLGLEPHALPRGRVTYDLRRLRLRGLIERIPHSHRYRVTQPGFRTALFFLKVHARILRPGPEERHRVGAYGLDDRQRGLERLAMVVEPPRPLLLVVALDDRVRLREDVTDTRVGVRLGVGAVADDLVGRPLPRRGAPLYRVLRDLGERRLEAGGAGGVLRDERLALGGGERHASAPRELPAQDLRERLGGEAELEERRALVEVLPVGGDLPAGELEEAHSRKADLAAGAPRDGAAHDVAERPLRGRAPVVLDHALHRPGVVAALVEHALEHRAEGGVAD